MEVQGRHHGNRFGPLERIQRGSEHVAAASRKRLREARQVMADLSRDRAEASKEAREEYRDRLDLSEVAQSAAMGKADPAREARIAELKAQHESGQLNTPARIELAADELLSSEASGA